MLEEGYCVPPDLPLFLYKLYDQGWRDEDILNPTNKCEVTSQLNHTFKMNGKFNKTTWNSFKVFMKRPTLRQATAHNYKNLAQWDKKAAKFNFAFDLSYTGNAIVEARMHSKKMNNNSNNNNDTSNLSNENDNEEENDYDSEGKKLRKHLPNLLFHVSDTENVEQSDIDIEDSFNSNLSENNDNNDSEYEQPNNSRSRPSSKKASKARKTTTTRKPRKPKQTRQPSKTKAKGTTKTPKTKGSKTAKTNTLKRGRKGISLICVSVCVFLCFFFFFYFSGVSVGVFSFYVNVCSFCVFVLLGLFDLCQFTDDLDSHLSKISQLQSNDNDEIYDDDEDTREPRFKKQKLLSDQKHNAFPSNDNVMIVTTAGMAGQATIDSLFKKEEVRDILMHKKKNNNNNNNNNNANGNGSGACDGGSGGGSGFLTPNVSQQVCYSYIRV